MIIPSQTQNLKVKPKWQASVGTMESVVAHNCRTHGMPVPVLALPFWEGAGNRAMDLSLRQAPLDIVNGVWTANGLKRSTGGYINLPSNSFWDDIVYSGQNPYTIFISYVSDIGYYSGSIGGTLLKIYGNSGNYIAVGRSSFWGSERINYTIYRLATNHGPSTGDVNFDVGDHIRIAAVFDGTDAHIYYNGALKNTASSPTFPSLGITSRSLVTSDFKDEICAYICFDVGLTDSQVKFISDNPYFMFRLPEELYGYTTAAPVGAIMQQFQKSNLGSHLYNGGIII